MEEDKCTTIEEAYARSFCSWLKKEKYMIGKFGGRFSSTVTRNCVDFKYSGITTRIIFEKYESAMVHLTLELSASKDGDEKKLALGHLQTLDSQLADGKVGETFVSCVIDEIVIPGLQHFYSQYIKKSETRQ